MKREFLKSLGIEDKEIIDQIMKQNGEDINNAKSESSGKASDLEEQIKQLHQQIKERDTQLNKLKDVNPKELNDKIKELQKENKRITEENEKTLKDLKLNNAIKLALKDKTFDEDIAASLIDKEKLLINDDKILGLDEQVESLKQSKPFLFRTNEVKQNYSPAAGSNSNDKNPFVTGNLTEQGKLYRENPDRARELAKIAGIEL